MRVRGWVSALLGLGVAVAPGAAQEPIDFDAPGALDEWTVSRGENYRFERDEAEARTGRASLRMERADDGEPNFLGVLTRRWTVEGENWASISGWIRTVGAGEARFGLTAEADGEVLHFDNMFRRGISGDSEWTRIETEIPLPAGTTALEALLYLNGRGTAWIDDVEVELIDRSSMAPPTEGVAEWMEEVLGHLETSALHRDRVDWDALRTEVRGFLGGRTRIDEARPVAIWAIRRLEDGHSSLMTPRDTERWTGTSEAPEDRFDGPWPEGELLEEGIGWLRIPSMPSAVEGDVTEYADRLLATIEEMAPEVSEGWVVDLRANYGGNMWPMLAGLSPLLDSDHVGSFVAPGREPSLWWARDGAAGVSGVEVARGTRSGPRLGDARVAVLLGGRTVSSGEATAIAFRGRPRTMHFGTPTRGLSTSNSTIPLSDGSTLLLTAAVFADRDGTEYGVPVEPDWAVLAPTEGDDDPTLDRAIRWLRGESG